MKNIDLQQYRRPNDGVLPYYSEVIKVYNEHVQQRKEINSKFLFSLPYQLPNGEFLPLDMTPLMTDEQYKLASEIEAQGYNYTEVAKAYNTQVQQRKELNNKFFSQFNYNEHIGIQELYDNGMDIETIKDSYGKNPEKVKALLNQIGSNVIRTNQYKHELSQDGFTGATYVLMGGMLLFIIIIITLCVVYRNYLNKIKK